MVSKSLRMLALVGIVTALFGPPGCDPTASIPSHENAPKQVDHSSVSKVVGTEGGTLEHPTGAKIVIPPGALDRRAASTLMGSPGQANRSAPYHFADRF